MRVRGCAFIRGVSSTLVRHGTADEKTGLQNLPVDRRLVLAESARRWSGMPETMGRICDSNIFGDARGRGTIEKSEDMNAQTKIRVRGRRMRL